MGISNPVHIGHPVCPDTFVSQRVPVWFEKIHGFMQKLLNFLSVRLYTVQINTNRSLLQSQKKENPISFLNDQILLFLLPFQKFVPPFAIK